MSWFAPELQPLLAIAVATLDARGTLIEANAGFLKLIDAIAPQPIGANVARCFIQPDLATLLRATPAPTGEIYRGLLTIGDYLSQSQTLHGRVWLKAGLLRILAEYDIEELRHLNDVVLELNHEYANAQLALATLNVKLQRREAELLAFSLTDPLTGVGNRRRLEQALVVEVSRAERSGKRFCALMADLDHFKRVNDGYGHEAGDRVLATFADILRRHTRPADTVARFGGEEFVVLMPDTVLANAVGVAERIRMALAAQRIEPMPEPITTSFGVAESTAKEGGSALLIRVDRALYVAKASGRDRVVAD
jgi:two-component system cell cycle response regulator